ncbi:MAG: hypothetical protein CMJ91_05445 [Planctomycetes bacterium]|nr:hypothetical protein [Planctomycetota bacterium]
MRNKKKSRALGILTVAFDAGTTSVEPGRRRGPEEGITRLDSGRRSGSSAPQKSQKVAFFRPLSPHSGQ